MINSLNIFKTNSVTFLQRSVHPSFRNNSDTFVRSSELNKSSSELLEYMASSLHKDGYLDVIDALMTKSIWSNGVDCISINYNEDNSIKNVSVSGLNLDEGEFQDAIISNDEFKNLMGKAKDNAIKVHPIKKESFEKAYSKFFN